MTSEEYERIELLLYEAYIAGWRYSLADLKNKVTVNPGSLLDKEARSYASRRVTDARNVW